MPRNPSGEYSLPAGQPVAPNTVVSSDVHNAFANDVADALTDSLSRSGDGGMLVPFYLADGTEAQPAMAFVNSPSTGMSRDVISGMLRFSISGVSQLDINADGNISAPNAAPSAEDHLIPKVFADANYAAGAGLATVVDCDLALTSGMFGCAVGVLNAPVDNDGMLTICKSLAFGSQMFSEATTNRVWVRVWELDGSTFSAWKELASVSSLAGYLPVDGTAANSFLLEGNAAAYFATAAGYLPLIGGTLTGDLKLPATPAGDSSAITKGYADANYSGGGGGVFISPQANFGSGDTLSFEHGLGEIPIFAELRLVCIVADDGYDVGDQVIPDLYVVNDTDESASTPYFDATTVSLQCSSDGSNVFRIAEKYTGTHTGASSSSWQVVIMAFTAEYLGSLVAVPAAAGEAGETVARLTVDRDYNILDSFNVSGVVDTNTGRIEVYYDTPIVNVNYTPVVSSSGSNIDGNPKITGIIGAPTPNMIKVGTDDDLGETWGFDKLFLLCTG